MNLSRALSSTLAFLISFSAFATEVSFTMDVPMSKVVRTRMFVTDISKWEAFGKAHAEFFADNPPTTSKLEINGLIDPEMMIEIEADAYAGKL